MNLPGPRLSSRPQGHPAINSSLFHRLLIHSHVWRRPLQLLLTTGSHNRIAKAGGSQDHRARPPGASGKLSWAWWGDWGVEGSQELSTGAGRKEVQSRRARSCFSTPSPSYNTPHSSASHPKKPGKINKNLAPAESGHSASRGDKTKSKPALRLGGGEGAGEEAALDSDPRAEDGDLTAGRSSPDESLGCLLTDGASCFLQSLEACDTHWQKANMYR